MNSYENQEKTSNFNFTIKKGELLLIQRVTDASPAAGPLPLAKTVQAIERPTKTKNIVSEERDKPVPDCLGWDSFLPMMDLSESEIYSFSDFLFSFRYLMLPEFLCITTHNYEVSMMEV